MQCSLPRGDYRGERWKEAGVRSEGSGMEEEEAPAGLTGGAQEEGTSRACNRGQEEE